MVSRRRAFLVVNSSDYPERKSFEIFTEAKWGIASSWKNPIKPKTTENMKNLTTLSPSASHLSVSAFAAALLGVATLAPSHAATWLDETFEAYSLGATPDNTTSPRLTSALNSTTVVAGNGGNMVRLKKSLVADPAPRLEYQLSPAYATPRPKGFISFKINRNADAGIGTGQHFSFGLGANTAASLTSEGLRLVNIRFYQTSSTTNLRIYSAATQIGSSTTYNPSQAVQKVSIWYNDDDSLTLPYTDPSGGAQALNTNTFVVYLGSLLVTPSASGSALTGAVGADLNLGKIGFTCISTSAVDMSLDDIYAADDAPAAGPPAITSSATANGYVGVPFSYQIQSNGPAATSFTASGLPATLAFNSSSGLISGTPDTAGVVNAVLTATNENGTSANFNLSINIIVPTANEFTGTNPSLNAVASWSLNSAPNSSLNVGSYKDLLLNSSVTALTTPSTNIYAQSWNVTNGSSYTLQSSAATSFKLGDSAGAPPFTNLVSGVQNDLIYLSGGSDLTFLTTTSPVEMRNSGNLNIGAGSVLDFQTTINDVGTLSLTKTGAGELILGTANTYAGGTFLTAGTLTVGDSGGLGTGPLAMIGGILQVNQDLVISPPSGTSTQAVIDGATIISVANGKTATIGRMFSNNPSAANVVTKEGSGTLALNGGGTQSTVIGGYQVKAGTLYYNTSANGGAGSGPVIMNGGNATFSKGPLSSGAYTGMALFHLNVLQETTLTLDPNPLTPSGSNTVSFASLEVGTKTIHVAKGPNALSSQETVGYADPSISFFSATLTGTLTLDAAQYTSVNLQAAVGSGAGVTKTGLGRLALADRVTGVDPNPIVVTPNSYTGPTIISAGTLAITGSHASPITMSGSTVLECDLDDLTASPAVSSSSLSLGTAAVRIVGTPTLSTYTLFTASSPISGSPVLNPTISGYSLAIVGNTLQLNATGGGTPFQTWAGTEHSLTGSNALPGTDVEFDGLSNLLEFVLGGNPKLNDIPSIRPQIANGVSTITLTFNRSDASELQPVAVNVKVSADLGIWNPADDITIGGSNGSGPNGVTYTVAENGAAADTIVVTIPKNSAARKFVRVEAVMP